MKTQVRKFLVENGYLPLRPPFWNRAKFVFHKKRPKSFDKDKKKIFDIFPDKPAIYLYRRNNRTIDVLYTENLSKHIWHHYKLSYRNKFFRSIYPGEVSIYWKEGKHSFERKRLIRNMLDYLYPPILWEKL